MTYNYIAYAIAVPLMWQSVLYLATVGLSVWAILCLLRGMDGVAVRAQLTGAVPERFGGGVLAGLGTMFFLRAGAAVIGALAGGTSLPPPEIAVLVADLLITPVWVVVGIALWRRQVFGYLTGTGLLFQACMLFVGLLAYFIMQPVVTDAPFPAEDFVAVMAMGLICFVPFGLFLRGVFHRRGDTSEGQKIE